MTQKLTPDDHSSASKTSGTSGGSALTQASAGKDSIHSVTHELSSEVSHMAGGIADEAKKAAEGKLGAGKDFAAEHLGSVAEALHKTSKSLGSDNVAAGYIEKAASSVDSVSEYFQTRTLSQLINDVEAYARREPAVFLGGAFFVGVLGGRFLKAATPATSAGQGAQGGSDGPRSLQGERRNGNGKGHSQDRQHQGGGQGYQVQQHPQHQGSSPQTSSGGYGGQGDKPSSSGQEPSTASTGSSSGSSASSSSSGWTGSGSDATRPKGSGAS